MIDPEMGPDEASAEVAFGSQDSSEDGRSELSAKVGDGVIG